jgi:hypothetical protein
VQDGGPSSGTGGELWKVANGLEIRRFSTFDKSRSEMARHLQSAAMNTRNHLKTGGGIIGEAATQG